MTSLTALDRHCAALQATLSAIAGDPAGPVARSVRDDLRRAHPVGVARNAEGVARLLRALPEPYRAGLLPGSRCRNSGVYAGMLSGGAVSSG